MLAKWHAIPDPMIPDPMTATFLMIRFINVNLFLMVIYGIACIYSMFFAKHVVALLFCLFGWIEYIFVQDELIDDFGDLHEMRELLLGDILPDLVIEFEYVRS